MNKLPRPNKKKSKWSSFSSLTIAASLVLSMGLQLQVPSFAASNSQLESLETKFFSHTYPKDGMEERLDRLEQMVFGEGKEGPHEPRLAKLLETVPLDSAPAQSQAQSQPSQSQSTAQSQQNNSQPQQSQSSRQEAPAVASSDDDGSVGNYPAINAIEEKVFKKNFAKEPIAARLTRLETKVLGKASSSNDLSERMDKLKQASGVDITANAPPGSEWSDDDDDIDYPSPGAQKPQYRSLNTPTSSPYVPRYGEDGRSFSGRDLRQDMNRAFGRNTAGSAPAASGNYGMGGSSSSSSSSGSYGMGGSSMSSSSSSPTATSDRGGNLNQLAYAPRTMPPSGGPSSMPQQMPQQQGMSSVPQNAPQRGGLNQQLDALEKQILGKTYSKDGMPSRLDRLEKTVFPQQQNLSQVSLPERVSRLLSVVPAGQPQQQSQPQQRIANKMDDDLDDDGNGIPNAPQRRGGIGKVLNSLGNMVGGFGVGSYTVSGNSMVSDPSTGYLYDQATGNLVDPASGAVVGRRSVTMPTAIPTAIPTYGYRPIGSGFSPYTTGYPTATPYSPYGATAVGPNSYGIPQTSIASPYGNPYGGASPYVANPYTANPYGTGYTTMPYANPMYGVGGTGIRFGTGFGGINMGGRWP